MRHRKGDTVKFFHFNEERCIGCRSCVMACKQKNDGISYRKVTAQNPTREQNSPAIYLSTSCENCPDPRCAEVCQNGAYTISPEGLVTHDTTKCKGDGTCIPACPHLAPIKTTHGTRKCDMCKDRPKGPFCVEACPQQALTLEDTRQKREVLL